MSVPGVSYALLVAKALALRAIPDRPQGLTPYYRNGIQSRLAAADAQLRHHRPTTRLIDIGCGRDLHLALVAAVCHGKQVTAFDVAPLAELTLINFTLGHLGRQPLGALSELESRYGIRYVVAPAIESAIDGCDGAASTAAFEHVPTLALRRMISCLASRLPSGAMVTAEIDYQDHWSYIAPVPPDHFYGCSDFAFALINPPRMFQNRVRHQDIVAWFSEAGFLTIHEDTEALPLTVPRSRYARSFRSRSDADLAIGVARAVWRLDTSSTTPCVSR